jgi:L-seryl-tRNA(Ser) seleniumtransferase
VSASIGKASSRPDELGSRTTAELPYARGLILRSTEDDAAKLEQAWRIIESRGPERVFNFTGLERALAVEPDLLSVLDDELAPALFGRRLTHAALEHLGGVPGRDDVLLANRLTAAVVAAMQVLVRPRARVLAVSPSYTHPAVVRAVRLAGGSLDDCTGAEAFLRRLERVDEIDLVVLTRLAVTYEALHADDLRRVVEAAHTRGIRVFVDDAGGARVGPAVLDQPRTLELGAEIGATGLDKYGTIGPRLGLLAGRAELVRPIRARALELGLEARPLFVPAALRSLEGYRPERVRELVATTRIVGAALAARLGDRVTQTPVAIRLEGEDVLAEAMARGGVGSPPMVPYEATAALAMLLLRDHGVLTVHFAAMPPGTAALLVKFVPPETLARFGGPERFAAAVDSSVDELARLLTDSDGLRSLLGQREAER